MVKEPTQSLREMDSRGIKLSGILDDCMAHGNTKIGQNMKHTFTCLVSFLVDPNLKVFQVFSGNPGMRSCPCLGGHSIYKYLHVQHFF